MKTSSRWSALAFTLVLSSSFAACSGSTASPGVVGPAVPQASPAPIPIPSITVSPSPVIGIVQNGHWGGTNFNMDVNDIGAKIQFACATGTIDSPLVMDSTGHFTGVGTYTQTSGPIVAGLPRPTFPASYSGTVDMQASPETLSIDVSYTDAQGQPQSGGHYTATFGRTGANTLFCAQ